MALPLNVTVDMSAVQLADQSLVRDLCAVLGTIYKTTSHQAIDSITVSSNGHTYIIVAKFPKASVTEICKSDLDTLSDINPLRVSGASILFDCESLHLKVKVCGFDHPLTVTDTDLVRVIKKRRWGIF